MSLEPVKFTHGNGEALSVILQYIWCNVTINVQNTKSLGGKNALLGYQAAVAFGDTL